MQRFAVFGNPVGHSKSPFIHTSFARQAKKNVSYEAILCPKDELKKELDLFFKSDGIGCNLTVPFKVQALDYVDKLTSRAKFAGSINTIKKQQDGTFLGDNTDGAGFVLDLKKNFIDIKDKNILVVGAGGAARGILYPILNAKPKSLILTNRNFEKAKAVAKHFSNALLKTTEIAKVNEMSFDLIINATSASLMHKTPLLGDSLIKNDVICYDLSYGSSDTAIIKWAKSKGCKLALDGLGMLVEQAAESFYLWHDIKPNTKPVLKELKRNLGRTN